MTKAELTELEGGVLALVREIGPCTAYAVVDALKKSPSAFWSGSAGAIYPLVERLHKRRLLSARSTATGQRKSKQYALTALGEEYLHDWTLDVARASDAGFDPLRTRLLSLKHLSMKERRTLLAGVKAQLMANAKEVEQSESASQTFRDAHALWLKHRLRWIAEIEKGLDA